MSWSLVFTVLVISWVLIWKLYWYLALIPFYLSCFLGLWFKNWKLPLIGIVASLFDMTAVLLIVFFGMIIGVW